MDDSDLPPARTLPPAVTVAVAFFAPLLICVGLVPVRGWVANTSMALLLILVVVAAAWLWDRREAYLAVVSIGLWFDFFWTVPFWSFAISDGDHLETTVMLVAVGAVITEMIMWGRRQQRLAARRSGYLDGVLDAAAGLDTGTADERREMVADRIVALLGLDRCRFVDTVPHDLPVLGSDGVVRIDGVAVDDEAGFPAIAEVVLPVRENGRLVGAFLATAATSLLRPDLERRRVAAAIADRAGALLAGTARGDAGAAH